MPTPRRLRLIALWTCVGATLVACGGSDSDPVTTPPPPVVPAPGGGGGGGGGEAQKPVATLTSPAHLATGLAGTFKLTATATDNRAVASVEFQVDGIAVGAPDTAAPYEVDVVAADHAAGQHIVRARAKDTAGNLSEWASATVKFGTAAVPKGFTLDNAWVTGLDNATAMAQAPDGRIFVTEQGGRVRVIGPNGVLQPGPFHVLSHATSSGERGAIGIALDPAFASNGWVYVHYTASEPTVHNRIVRLTASGATTDGVETSIFELPTLSGATNHNGGAIHFGADGKLYVGVGDNANGAHAESKTSLFGKVLRLNPDGSLPTDNPFYTAPNDAPGAIWAYGLRNPFTFAVQPVTGAIHVNDVGQDTWEEVNVLAKGANYGWPDSEGPDRIAAGLTAPLFAYRHAANPAGPGGFFQGSSIAGGTFYPATGGTFPAAYRSNYFFADFGSDFVARLDPANGHAATAFAQLGNSPVDLMTGNDGALYVLYRNVVARISAP